MKSLCGRPFDICAGNTELPAGDVQQYRALYGSQGYVLPRWIPGGRDGDCIHRGRPAGTQDCPTCNGNVRVKLYACGKHGQCTLGKPMDGVVCCARCDDYQSTETTSATPIILRHDLSPGDVVVLTGALRALHDTYPGKFLTDVRTPCPAIWEHNPLVTPLGDGDANIVTVNYDLIHTSNQRPLHFLHAFCAGLAQAVGVDHLDPTTNTGEIHLSDDERRWTPQVQDLTGRPTRYWIVNAGRKSDFTAKLWPPESFQRVIDQTDVTWVQIGSTDEGHWHPDLSNVIDLRGKTDLRQLIRLVYHAEGVLTGVSLPMHLAAAVPRADFYQGFPRPCVVLAGGREPQAWNTYPGQSYLTTIGRLDCCKTGGCWKSRAVPLKDGQEQDHSLCEHPDHGFPRCLRMIAPQQVVRIIEECR